VYCNDEHYDEDWLSDNDIVQLECGDYCSLGDAVFVESCGEYYEQDDDRVCYDDYNGRYELRDDCVELEDGSMCHSDDAWMCEATDTYYSDNDSDDRVKIDGKFYHKDNAPVTDDEVEEAAEPRIVAVTINDSLTDSITYNYLRNAR